MELSCKLQYVLVALLQLASHYDRGEPLSLSQITANQNIPDRYLEQLLVTLRCHDLVESQRGPKGGYLLARAPWKITLLDVMTCLEGTESESKTQNGILETDKAVIKEVWQEVSQEAKAILRRYTLQDLRQQRDDRQQKGEMYHI